MNVKKTLLIELSNANGEYISGSELARQLGVSRNAVWKAVKALENDGYNIESVTAKGYRLSSDNNVISSEIIASKNKSKRLCGEIIILNETTSTNNYAKELAANGAAHGTVIIAEKQTSGKGRLGRKFESPSGKGLYMSVIVRPEFPIEFAPLITSAAAVASAEAVEKLCDCHVGVKWVNDLYMNGKKICGILTEASLGLEMNMLDFAVIGIGINVRSFDFGSELNSRVTTIEDASDKIISRNELCALILERLEIYLDGIENRSHLEEYRRREILTGNIITANAGNQTVRGFAEGVDDNANLRITLEDGKEFILSSGEANLCRIIK